MTPEQRRHNDKLARHSAWLIEHPWWARGIALWLTLAVLDLAELIRLGLDMVARSIR